MVDEYCAYSIVENEKLIRELFIVVRHFELLWYIIIQQLWVYNVQIAFAAG